MNTEALTRILNSIATIGRSNPSALEKLADKIEGVAIGVEVASRKNET